ncbi:MAG: DUF1330 domain-containing protein [Thalassovita sp.]
MPYTVIVQMDPIDPELLAQYRPLALAPILAHGGQVLAAGPHEVLEDTQGGPLGTVVLRFPTEEAAKGWFNDPEIAEIHAMRNKAAKSTITLYPEFQVPS